MPSPPRHVRPGPQPVRTSQILLSHAPTSQRRVSLFLPLNQRPRNFQFKEKKNQLSSPSCSRRKECRRDGIDPRVTTVSAKRFQREKKKNILSRLFGQDVQHQIRHVSQSFVLRSTPRFTVNLPSPPCQRKKTGHSIISVRVRVFLPQLCITFGRKVGANDAAFTSNGG